MWTHFNRSDDYFMETNYHNFSLKFILIIIQIFNNLQIFCYFEIIRFNQKKKKTFTVDHLLCSKPFFFFLFFFFSVGIFEYFKWSDIFCLFSEGYNISMNFLLHWETCSSNEILKRRQNNYLSITRHRYEMLSIYLFIYLEKMRICGNNVSEVAG